VVIATTTLTATIIDSASATELTQTVRLPGVSDPAYRAFQYRLRIWSPS
jgi:hypothetical protein